MLIPAALTSMSVQFKVYTGHPKFVECTAFSEQFIVYTVNPKLLKKFYGLLISEFYNTFDSLNATYLILHLTI